MVDTEEDEDKQFIIKGQDESGQKGKIPVELFGITEIFHSNQQLTKTIIYHLYYFNFEQKNKSKKRKESSEDLVGLKRTI